MPHSGPFNLPCLGGFYFCCSVRLFELGVSLLVFFFPSVFLFLSPRCILGHVCSLACWLLQHARAHPDPDLTGTSPADFVGLRLVSFGVWDGFPNAGRRKGAKIRWSAPPYPHISPSRCLPKVLPASVAPPRGSAVGGSFVSPSGRTSCRGSSATSIWASPNGPEEDVELSKPGVLLSLPGESPRVAARPPGGAAATSEATDHLGLSSDPLLMSSDGSDPGETHEGSASGRCSSAPGREEAGETRSSSPLSWRTAEIRVDHSPSALLEASNELRDGAGGVGSPPASHSRGGRGVPSPGDSPGDSPGFSLPYLVPAVGIALISAVAFLVYARLQK